MTQTPEITCSAHELTLLARLIEAPVLFGIEDPYAGWLAEEIAAAWEGAQGALRGRGYLVVGAGGRPAPAPAIAPLIAACAFPEASFTLTRTQADGRSAMIHWHVDGHLAVEQTRQGDQYHIEMLEDAGAVYRQIVALLALDRQPAPAVTGGQLPDAQFAEARRLAGARDRVGARMVLLRAGLDAETAVTLAHTLAHPQNSAALVGLARRTATWEVGGLGLLEGEAGLWHLRAFTREGVPWVEARPCTAAYAHEYLRRVMNRVLPTPLAASSNAGGGCP